MIKRMCKIILAIMIETIMIANLTGCGKTQEDTTDMVYEGTELSIEKVEGTPEQYCIQNGMIYISSCQQMRNTVSSGENDGQNNILHFYKMDLSGDNFAEIPVKLPENQTIHAFFVGKDGNIIYIASDMEKTSYQLIKMDLDGKELQKENITELMNTGEKIPENNILVNDNGNVIVASDQTVYILDENFQHIGEVKAKDNYHVYDIALTKSGQVVCALYEESAGQLLSKVNVLDVECTKWGDTLKVDDNIFGEGDCIMSGSDFDLYYKCAKGIYGYTIEDKKSTKLLDSGASYLTSQDIRGMVPAGDGRFISVLYDMEEESCSLELFTKADSAEIADKQVITYGTYGVQDNLMRAAREFNKANSDYKIEFIVYDDEDYTRMFADFIAGNIPDIISMDSLPLSVQQCVAKGLLEDLTSYYEKDSEINTDELVGSVYEAMKIDGKLYYLAPYFTVYSIVGKSKNVGNETGWTFEDINTILEDKGSDVVLCNTDSKSDMLSVFLQASLSDYVDWKTGECYFTNQDFKKILELCNQSGEKVESDEYDAEYYNNMRSLLRQDKILVSVGEGTVSLEQVQLDRQIFGEDITYIGFPSEDKQGSYFEFVNKIGIYAKSDVKDKAWEFCRFVMTREYQGKIDNLQFYAMPTRQDCLDLRIEAMMATEPYTNELGQEIEPLEQGSRYLGDLMINYGPISQEDVEEYLSLVNSTKKATSLDKEMMEIILEEAEGYFKGKNSLEETTEIIQKRIETYVNEQR